MDNVFQVLVHVVLRVLIVLGVLSLSLVLNVSSFLVAARCRRRQILDRKS